MAKEIEIAFSLVRNRKSVKKLKITEFGGYTALIQSCLMDGFDPLPEDPTTLQFLSRSTPKQWARCNKAIMEAVYDCLPVLERAYRKAEARFDRFSKRGTNNFSGYWDKLRLARAAKDNVLNSAKQFSDDASRASLLQPLRSPQTYSQKIKQPKQPLTGPALPLTDE